MSPEEQRESLKTIRALLAGSDPISNVLLVEDNINDGELVLRAFREAEVKIDIVWSRTIEDALHRVKTSSFWVIFLDLHFPGEGNGMRFLSSVDPSKHRVIVLTGAHSRDDSKCLEALKAGALAVMLKPLREEEIKIIFGVPIP